MKRNNKKFPSGFSLIELMVVIAIIAVLMGLSVSSLKGLGQSSGARGAADLAASVALSARIEAMAFGRGSLFLIDNSGNPEWKYRRMAVIRRNEEDTEWELIGKPVELPKGIYLLPDYSSTAGTYQTNVADLKGIGPEVFSYRFSGSGYMDEKEAITLVFSANIADEGGELKNPEGLLAGRRGIKIRKNARPIFFKNAEQMQPNPTEN